MYSVVRIVSEKHGLREKTRNILEVKTIDSLRRLIYSDIRVDSEAIPESAHSYKTSQKTKFFFIKWIAFSFIQTS